MENNKTPLQSVSFKRMKKQGIDVLSAFGGYAIGKLGSKFLDKKLKSKTVQGLVGVELSKDVAKWVKPIVITGIGLSVAQIGSSKRQKPLVYAGLGFASVGVNDIFVIITGKDALSGLSDEFEDVNIVNGLEGAYQIEEPTPLDLPKLGTAETGFDYEPAPLFVNGDNEPDNDDDDLGYYETPVFVNGDNEPDNDDDDLGYYEVGTVL